jgi:hypothetical protein
MAALPRIEPLLRRFVENSPTGITQAIITMMNEASKELSTIAGRLVGANESLRPCQNREQIDRLKLEIGQAMNELEASDTEVARLEVEIGVIQRQQPETDGSDAKIPGLDPSYITSPCYRRTLRAAIDKILCPVCHEKPRDTIIIGCGHPFCRTCLDMYEFGRFCPRCRKPYTVAQLKDFFYGSRFTTKFAFST